MITANGIIEALQQAVGKARAGDGESMNALYRAICQASQFVQHGSLESGDKERILAVMRPAEAEYLRLGGKSRGGN